MTNRAKQKGKRAEYLIRDIHTKAGFKAEVVPLSGASRHNVRLEGCSDVDLYLEGQDETPFIAEVKSRKDDSGFKIISQWLGENDLLFVKTNNKDPFVVVPLNSWKLILEIISYALVRGFKP